MQGATDERYETTDETCGEARMVMGHVALAGVLTGAAVVLGADFFGVFLLCLVPPVCHTVCVRCLMGDLEPFYV